ncbi:MAG: AMP-binding protein [Lutibacter sp.]|uniref:AMP-binding protein n=1 Tax=Lutibacter sp. TaxID=1925666 RepID=UPI00385E8FAE
MKIETQFHKAFKLQGESFNSSEEIIVFSKIISLEMHSFLKQWFNTSSFIEVKTSGSTGKPKVIQLQKTHMKNSAIATGNFFSLPENTTALLCMSPNYIAGKMMLVRALTLGWHLEVVEATSKPLENTSKVYDFAAMVPLQLTSSLSEIYKVKKLIVGGGGVSKELLGKIQKISTEVFATYGMTETITHIAVKKLNNFGNVIASEMKQSHYKLLPDIKIFLDSRGCLVIVAPKISSEKIITNDLVELISETEFMWLGRFDSIINSGGIKLIPEQIEEKLATIIKQRFFVTGILDEVLGEKLILIVEGTKDNSILTSVKKLKILSKFEIPKEIFFTNQFIETETRKISRKETLKIVI